MSILLHIQFTHPKGRSVMLYEVYRPTPSTTSTELAAMAQRFVSMGADALVVNNDPEATPEGFKDLFTVSKAVKVPSRCR